MRKWSLEILLKRCVAMFCYNSVFWTSISASFIQMQYIWTILKDKSAYLWRMWDVKISYCWGVIKILLMWRTTLLLADCTWGDLCQKGGYSFSSRVFTTIWRKTFYFSLRRLLPRCASSGDGGAEDFSWALRLPSICIFSIFIHY